MKLKFDQNLDYQTKAVNSVVNLFDGQNPMSQYFTVSGQSTLDSNYGIGNKLDISKKDILNNLKNVRSTNDIKEYGILSKDLNFNIEMETGTGKTYVYLKTIFELNKQYNFTKFIIVVPNLAVKEGVNKTIEITNDHFKGIYDNVIYDHFVYDSSKLEQVRNFAVSSNIQIMIINISAFNKKTYNVINQEQDKLNGFKPIELIAETNPIVIIDEPQLFMNDNGEDAVSYLNPLCTLRYSATHKNIQNIVYKLNAVEAYKMKLVKQIEVDSIIYEDDHNNAYLSLVSTNNKPGSPISANIKIDKKKNNGTIKRETVKINQGTDLSELSKREIYDGYIVDEICCEKGNEYVTFTQKDEILLKGEKWNDIDDSTLKRFQIRKTIKEHLEKELNFAKKGKKIKVLSLFFVDKVCKYREYDKFGNPVKGEYAKIFEEEYNKLIKDSKYSTLYNNPDAEEVHNGYFAVDKDNKQFKDTKEKLYKDDETAVNLIMKDKEKLLNFDTKLKFIFSHSALGVGWDNPNVFQICTLNNTSSEIKRRQEIGRGLRLCVNQDGERINDENINILTIIANESYEEFARNLQTEIENETNIKFDIIKKNTFENILWFDNKGEKVLLGKEHSKVLFNHFKNNEYINSEGKVLEKFKVDIRNNSLDIPEEYLNIKDKIIGIISKSKSNIVQNSKKRKKVKLKEDILSNKIFKLLWDKIKHKTTYHVEFDTEELVSKCIDVMQEHLNVYSPKVLYTKSRINVNESGVNYNEKDISTVSLQEYEMPLPDILEYIQNETDLTRKTIIRILKESNTLNQFKKNPQQYMQDIAKLINKEMGQLLVNSIKYTKLDDSYSQELFKNKELFGYLDENLIKTNKSIYEYTHFDSKIEKRFAERLDNDPDIKLFTKLPNWFTIETPIGTYNPDWAVVLDDDGEKIVIIETKGTTDYLGIRPNELNKIKCGENHFKALDNGVKYIVSDSYEDFKSKI